MALQPVTFQKAQRRAPSLVSQAIVGTLAGVAKKKLIDEPLMTARQEFATAERRAGEEAASKTNKTRIQAALDLEDKRSKNRQAGDAARLAGEVGAAEEGLIDIPTANVLGTDIAASLEGGIERFEDRDPLNPGIQLFAPGSSTRRASDTLTRLQNLLTTEQRSAQTAATRDQTLQLILRDARVKQEDLPPMLLPSTDPDTGVETFRFLTQEEQSIRAMAHPGNVAALSGFQNNQIVQSLLAEARELEKQLVTVPAYDDVKVNAFLGGLTGSSPNSENIAQIDDFVNQLRAIGVVGGRDRGRFFTNDQGEVVNVRNDEQLLLQFPVQARRQFKGVVWAQFFPKLEQYERAKVQYNLNDPIAENTYKQLIGVPTPPGTPKDPSIAGPGEPTVVTGEPEPIEFITPAAKAITDVDEQSTLATYVERFSDPTLDAEGRTPFEVVAAEIETQMALPDDSLRQVLEDAGQLQPVATERFRGPGRLGSGAPLSLGSNTLPRTLPDRDKYKIELLNLLNVARLEAAERRKQ